MKEITGYADIMNIANAFRESRIFLTAFELGIFAALGNQYKSSDIVSKIIKTNPRATDRLMNALTAIGFLNKKNGKFCNTELTLKFLVKNNPGYMAGIMHYVNLWDGWSTMTDAVKKGTSVTRKHDEKINDSKWLDAFISAMHMRGKTQAREIASLLNLQEVKRLLDVGGGSGAFSFEFIRRNNNLKAIIFDLPEVIKLTRKYIKSEGLNRRIDTIAGDYLKDNLGKNYDMIFLSAIIHSNSYEENMKLIKRCSKVLNKKGLLVISDWVMNNERTKPYAGAIFALNMLVNTEAGDTYTKQEISEWFSQAGIKLIKKIKTENEASVMIGRKL